MELRPSPINVVVEGPTDRVVVSRVLDYLGIPLGLVHVKQGKAKLLKRLPYYNRAAQFVPWIVVVDLDQSPLCAPAFVRQELPSPAQGMLFRVAVRAVESWLLADAERLSAFLSVSVNRIPDDPDAEPDPKVTLVNLARQSRRSSMRRDMVPRSESGARVGPGYTSRVIEFVTATEHPWRPEVAMQRSDSLRRCVDALRAYHSRIF